MEILLANHPLQVSLVGPPTEDGPVCTRQRRALGLNPNGSHTARVQAVAGALSFTPKGTPSSPRTWGTVAVKQTLRPSGTGIRRGLSWNASPDNAWPAGSRRPRVTETSWSTTCSSTTPRRRSSPARAGG